MTSAKTGTPGRQYSPAPGAKSPNNDNGDIDFQLTREDASVEERRKGFSLLHTLAARSVSADRRQDYYDTIVIPTDYSIVDLQIGALDTLTDGGRVLVPFETGLIIFLNSKLKELSTVSERLRVENRDNGPRTSVYGSESPTRGSGSEKVLSSKEPAGAEKALLVSGLRWIPNHRLPVY